MKITTPCIIRLKGRHPELRRMFEQAHGRKIPPGYVAGHICGDTRCCNLDHIRVQTPQENSREIEVRRFGATYTRHQLWGSHYTWARGLELPPLNVKQRARSTYSRDGWQSIQELGRAIVKEGT